MTTRQFITKYHGQNIYFSLSARMYLVDMGRVIYFRNTLVETGRVIYFRKTLDEVKYLIDNLEGLTWKIETLYYMPWK